MVGDLQQVEIPLRGLGVHNTYACILELYHIDDLYRKKGFYRAYLHDQ